MPARTKPKPKKSRATSPRARKAAPKSRRTPGNPVQRKPPAPSAAPAVKRGPKIPPPPAPGAAPHVAAAERYVAGVLDGTIPACRLTRLACARHRRDMATAAAGGRFVLDVQRAERACNIIELLPHIKGEKAKRDELIVLGDWQCFITVSIFGWVDRKTGLRRFRKVYIEVARKNGKSTLLAAILIVLTFFDAEAGADGYSAATTRDQARIVFKTAQEMIRKCQELRDRYGVDLLAHTIVQESSGSKIEALSADAHTLDGLNPHVAVVDEVHAHKSRKVWDVLETAQGARAQPMLIGITTAGDDISGICYEIRTYVVKILDHVATDDSTFGIVYTIDETDDWTTELAWRKANPNYGVSVYPEYLADLARKAIQTPAAQANFKTKHLDVWVSSNSALYSVEAWKACARPDLTREDLKNFPCITGVDLASTNDLCSAYDVYRDDSGDEPVFYVLGRNYVPEDTIRASRIAQYPGWEETERLIATPGDSTDYQRIEDDLLELAPPDRREVVLDKYQSRHLATRLQAEGITVVELAMNVSTLSEPTKMLDVLMRRQRILHDGDPLLEWAISNVVGHVDAKDNVYPRKERPENKIDPAIAVLEALSRWLSSEISGPTVLETEGIRFA